MASAFLHPDILNTHRNLPDHVMASSHLAQDALVTGLIAYFLEEAVALSFFHAGSSVIGFISVPLLPSISAHKQEKGHTLLSLVFKGARVWETGRTGWFGSQPWTGKYDGAL